MDSKGEGEEEKERKEEKIERGRERGGGVQPGILE